MRESQPAFCIKCGKQLAGGAVFCAYCGTPVEREKTSQPLSPHPAADPPDEQVLFIIPNGVRKSGFMGVKQEIFTVLVTNQRFIFAFQSKEMIKANLTRAREAAKQEGKGFFGQWGAQLKANNGQVYQDLSPQAALAERPENFFYLYQQVNKVKLSVHSDDESMRTTYRLEFETATGKLKLEFDAMDPKSTRAALRELLGDRVR